jgi:hypothetical protein
MINNLPGHFTWVTPLKYGYDNVFRVMMKGDIGQPAYFNQGQKAVIQTVGYKKGGIQAFGKSVVDAFQKFMADQMEVSSQLLKKPVYFYAAKTGADGVTKYTRHKIIDQGSDITQAPVQKSSKEAQPISKMWFFLVLGWLKVKGKDGVLDVQSEVELMDLFQESYRVQRKIKEFRLKDYSNSLARAEDAFLINAAKIKGKMGLEDLPIDLLKTFYSVSDAALGFPDLISALRSDRLRKNDLRMIQRQCCDPEGCQRLKVIVGGMAGGFL